MSFRFNTRENRTWNKIREKIFESKYVVTRSLDGLSDSAAAIGFTRRVKNDRVIMQHFPTQQENMSTYAIKVLSRREIRETAQGSARELQTYAPFAREVLPFNFGTYITRQLTYISLKEKNA